MATLVQRLLGLGASRCHVRNERIAAAAWDTWNARIAAAAWDTRSPRAAMRQCKIITGDYKISRKRSPRAAMKQRKIITGDYKISWQAVGMCLMENLQRRILHPPLEVKLMVKHALQLLKLSRIEMRLKQTLQVQISYSQLLYICLEDCSRVEQTIEMLLESGSIVFYDGMVFLGERGVKSMKERIQELENLEKQKSIIDEKALSLVRRELRFVILALVGGHAVAALPSWRPLLYFSSSFYLIGKFVFFIRTGKNPTLTALFESRLKMKQAQLMRRHGFDIRRYQELKEDLGSYKN